MTSCLIVGAGISGLLAAVTLQDAGWDVTVLDKGRGVGGRMSHRRLSDDRSARADHGAQFFTVRHDRFQEWVTKWELSGAVRVWTHGFAGEDGHPRYCGTTGMNDISKQLAQGLTVHTQAKVTVVHVTRNGRWQAKTESGKLYEADALLMTSPAPQTLALLRMGDVALPEEATAALEAIAYNPCFAVLAVLNSDSRIPSPGGVQVRGPIIDWIGDNRQKGISERTAVTIHASPDFTKAHLNESKETVAELILQAAADEGWFDRDQVEGVQVHRWLYAQPTILHPERTLFSMVPAPIAFAGDAFLHARVEGAALSGLAAADWLLQTQ